MVGMVSYGAYVPIWRIDRDEIAHAAGVRSMGGERTVASWGEDSLTMGVEAALDCLQGWNPRDVDGVYFATLSSPYKEKLASSILACALDMKQDVRTIDFTSSARAGTLAMKAALDSVQSGGAKKILVVASDNRKALPRSEFEQINGAGAAALLVGQDNIIAGLNGFSTISNPIPGIWHRQEDHFQEGLSLT